MFKSIRVGAPRTAVQVVGVFAGGSAPRGTKLDAAMTRRLTEAAKTPGFKADVGETHLAGADLLLVGLGARDAVEPSTLRLAGAAVVRRLDRMGAKGAALTIAEVVPARSVDRATAGRAFAEGLGLANWRVDFFDGSATRNPEPLPALTVSGADADFRKGLAEGLELAECANEARRIAATPPNICNPDWIAKEARALTRGTGLTCRVIRYADLERQGFGGIVNVGKGSASKPCMIILEHKPARAKAGTRVALVGKTMTYDSGGYSMKGPANMKGMKYDGNGGCAVLGAMLAIAKAKLPVHVVALLPAAENMVSDEAYRPDDIITLYNGVSVEVTNTDAEGRLILGDALAYACKKVKPTAIIDVATLTGGVVVALGEWCAGLFGNDDELIERIEDAADATDERVWQLPLWPEHRDFMRAKHADVWNSGPKRDGHPIQGAAFLSFFVDEDVPWAHLDIAGVSAVDSDRELHVTGPTGFGVRLLTEVVRGFA